jgi:transposase
MIRTRTKPVFKISNQKQTMIFLPSLDKLIADDHPVRIVDDIINKLDLTTLYNLYPGGGASSYDAEIIDLCLYQ